MNWLPVQMCQNYQVRVRSEITLANGPGKLTMQPKAQISELLVAGFLLVTSGAAFRR